jgi:hypothetical protein
MMLPEFEDDFHTIFTPPIDTITAWYLEVGHLHKDDEHYDLLVLPCDTEPELFFRYSDQQHHTSQTMLDAFFAPLCNYIQESRLDLGRISMSITIVDEHGLRRVGLPAFLQTLGLL